MASTATEVIAKFRRTYPNCSTTDASSLLQDALYNIYTLLQLRNTEIQVSLTAGTREYDLDVNAANILSARYEVNANSTTWTRLDGTSTDELDMQEPNWRGYSTNSTPTRYYVTSAVNSDSAKNVIGFLPVPDTTTSASYPRVTLVITQYASLTSSETMPSNLLSDDVLVYYMCHKWAIRVNDDQSIGKWQALFDVELGRNQAHITRMSGNEDTIRFHLPTNTLTRLK